MEWGMAVSFSSSACKISAPSWSGARPYSRRGIAIKRFL